MSAKILSSLTDENRNLRKQIGCIFQIFDRRHLLSSRRLSGHDQTKLDLLEHKEKPRRSVDSISRASNSSSEIQYERIARKEPKTPRSPGLRDVVKDSMYREAAAAHSIKQHVDSPRPLRRKPADKERCKDDQEMMMMAPRRFSYDGREAKSASSTMGTRVKELPRLSLDSRAGSVKFSSSESRSDLLDRFHAEYESRSVEPGNHRRSSSIVAKLMGLESFPELDEDRTRNSISNPKEIHRLQQNVSQSPRSRYADSFQGSPKTARTSSSSSTHLSSSSSVYGEIEKRIAELEFKKSGKDLRALKQILEAMQKTRERIESRIERSAAEISAPRRRNGSEDVSYDPKSNSPIRQNRKINGPTSPKAASIEALNVHRLQNSSTKSNKETTRTPPRLKARALEPKRDMEQDRTLKAARGSKAKSCTSSISSSSRFQQNPFHDEESTRPSTPTSEPVRVRKHSSKKVVERNSQDKRIKSKSKTHQLIDTQLNEVSGEGTCSSYQGDAASLKSESNYNLTSPMDADNCVEQQKYLKTRREPMSPFQLEEISIEQPSPVSVLDAAFYGEDPPSPVRKITLAFQDDEDPISDETEYRRSDMARAYYPESEGSRNSAHITEFQRSDILNEIQIRKNMPGGLYTQDLAKEGRLELNSTSTIQNSNLDDDEDDDGMLKLIASDMKHESEDWTRCKSEVPALVLDIERLIFKDLVSEVLTNTAF